MADFFRHFLQPEIQFLVWNSISFYAEYMEGGAGMIAMLNHKKLRRELAVQEIKQEPFAEQVGITDRHVRNLCKKDVDVKVSVLYNVSSTLKIPMSELLVLRDNSG